MTYYGAKELADSFRTVRNNTLKIAEEIPEDKYSFSAAPKTRTVALTLAHIAVSYQFQYMMQSEKRTNFDGLDFPTLFQRFVAEQDKPRTKAEILELLRSTGDTWAQFVEGLSESFLGETVSMPPGTTPATKGRLEMILSVKEHEMHHRGQLMLVERMIGIVPHLTRDMEARMTEMTKARTA